MGLAVEAVQFFFIGAIVGLMILNILGFYSYQRLLHSKAQKHEVEFLKGEPIVLLPEKDYIELKFKKKD